MSADDQVTKGVIKGRGPLPTVPPRKRPAPEPAPRRVLTAGDDVVRAMAEVVAAQIDQCLSLDSPLVYAQVAMLAEAVLGRPVTVSPEALERLARIADL